MLFPITDQKTTPNNSSLKKLQPRKVSGQNLPTYQKFTHIFGLGLCNCCWLSASFFRYYATSIFTFTDDVFQGPSTFTRVHLNMFFFDDIECTMYKIVIAYRPIFESEKGASGIHCTSLPPPPSLKYRVIKALELCSSGKEAKRD